MKKKLETGLKVNLTSGKKVPAPQVTREKLDETYVQVNQLSFQQNFKALIGHYKTSDVAFVL
ncbi:MAG: hypothetical protein H7235_03955 [Bdellovibrionaceae bacterium]|nr:hypothetical protein [Pseudobdellovibrionaceae bacterium]